MEISVHDLTGIHNADLDYTRNFSTPYMANVQLIHLSLKWLILLAIHRMIEELM